MFQVTFLGHQGWLFRGPDTALLADPLLRPGFGHSGDHWQVWPPRQLDLSAFPRIDAVFLSHEHEDHFDIGSLHRLPRTVQLFAPRRSSESLFGALTMMGFERVVAYRPGDRLEVGALELFTFPSDATREDTGDEWDVGPYLVRERGGAGSFFTNVDTQLTAGAEAMLQKIEPDPGLWSYTNNSVSLEFTRAGRQVAIFPPQDTAGVAATILDQHGRRCRSGRSPRASLLSGNGWCFSGSRQPLNELAFHADNAVICQGLSRLLPDHPFRAALPGLNIAMENNRIVAMDDQTEFLRPLAAREWPPRGASGAVELMEDYLPLSAHDSGDQARKAALAAGLDELAAALASNGYLSRLALQESGSLSGRQPRVALVLLRAEGNEVLELDPEQGRFVPSDEEDVFATHAVGMECWASDLAAVFSGELTFTAVGYGALREWTFTAPGADLSLARQLWMFDHPLRRPAVFLDRYRRAWARARAGAPNLKGPLPSSGRSAPRPVLSVVMPFRNEGPEPERTVRSILETAPPGQVEILALDDCSDDLSAGDALQRWGEVRYLRAPCRQGADAGRDRGVTLARGDNILIIDAHMRFRPDGWVDKLVQAIEGNPRTVFCTTSVDIGWDRFDLRKLILDDTSGLEKRYGARLRLFGLSDRDPLGHLHPGGYPDIVDAEDIRDRSALTRPLPAEEAFVVSCIMGANYALKRSWYQKLHGVRGLMTWGCTEPLLSLKSYLAGGSCGVLTSVEIGHLYRAMVKNAFPLWHLLYNKLMVAQLLLPDALVARMQAHLEVTPELRQALTALRSNASSLRREREYLNSIFCRDAEDVLRDLEIPDHPPLPPCGDRVFRALSGF